MEGEGSPITDIVGDASKGPLPEASMASSPLDASSQGAASDIAKAEAKVSVDPCELAWSYDFGASSVMVRRIQQLKSLGYFAKGSACEPGEETVLEPNPNEVVVFEEFFCRGTTDVASSCFHRDSAQILGAAAPTDPEHYCSDVEVFLGGAELWRGT
jgi:hypothetical protein